MANEAHDPWALLREAREALDYVGQVPTGERNSRARALERRIDAALAEHADSATPVVEWIDYGEWGAKSTQIDGFALTVRAHGLPGPWHWEAPRCSGYAATKDEAKSAAIAAARGLK